MKDKLITFLKNYEEELLNAAKELNNQQFPQLTEELFSQFERTGNRLGYENIYFKRRKFLSVYAICSMLYERENDLLHLEEVLESICEEECWALPAHVNRHCENWQITIDLFSAETAFSLAEIVGKLEGKLSATLCDKVRNEVFRRVLNPYMESQKPYADWETSKMNWCAVCCGSIRVAAIWLMQNDKEKLDSLLQRVSESIVNYIDGFSEDGACLEGILYYTYGMSFFAAFADLAYKYSNGKIDLMSRKEMEKIALFQQKCFLLGDISLCFSDSSMNEKYRVGLTSYLAGKFESVTFPGFCMSAGLESDNCYRYGILSRNIFWTQEYLKKINKNLEESNKSFKETCMYSQEKDECSREKDERYQGINEHPMKMLGTEKAEENHSFGQTVLPDAQWSINTSKNNSILAAKGGHNGEPHNHNDVGSFIYACEGEVILTDLGAGEYTGDYFNENRYTHLCCRSLGHNVPIVDGREQCPGQEYAATVFETDGKGKTVIEFAKAYGFSNGEKIRRAINFDCDKGGCKITDEFVFEEKISITENLISAYQPAIIDKGFCIHTPHNQIVICNENGNNYRILEEEYIDHFGKKQKAWLMQWDVKGTITNIEITRQKV